MLGIEGKDIQIIKTVTDRPDITHKDTLHLEADLTM
jgi:hypothetical protein